MLGSGVEPGKEARDEDVFLQFCIDASRMFDTWVTNGVQPKRRFYPQIATKTFDHPSDSPGELRLRDDLLELTTLTTENGATNVSLADVVLTAPSGNANQSPYARLKLKENGTTTTYSFNGTMLGSNSVTGIWGFHDSWSDAWQSSGDSVQDDPLTDSATTITVVDADGNDINGLPWRFQKQQLIRIESEYLWITDIDRTANKLTVRRAMNGSTAAAHVQNTQIDVFVPMYDVRHAMQALTTFLYQRKESIGTAEDRPMATMAGRLILPSTLPEEVRGILKGYRKEAL
jgi:hypothetical protein